MSSSNFNTTGIDKRLAELKAANAKSAKQPDSGLADNSNLQTGNAPSSSSLTDTESKLINSLALTTKESKIDDLNKGFSLDAINSHFNKTNKNYMIGEYGVTLLPKNRNFFSLVYLGTLKAKCEEGNLLTITGLEFHISLPEPENERLELSKGWEIINSTLRAHQANFKKARSHMNMFDDPDQREKIVTVYATAEKTAKEWESIFQELTEKLVAANIPIIPPGFKPPGTIEKPERELNGCNYVTYRYLDEDHRLEKLPPDEREKITAILNDDMQIIEEHDPIAKLKVTVANQPDIQNWEENIDRPALR